MIHHIAINMVLIMTRVIDTLFMIPGFLVIYAKKLQKKITQLLFLSTFGDLLLQSFDIYPAFVFWR